MQVGGGGIDAQLDTQRRAFVLGQGELGLQCTLGSTSTVPTAIVDERWSAMAPRMIPQGSQAGRSPAARAGARGLWVP